VARGGDTDWLAITERNARSVQTFIGWIFWDPGAEARYYELGLAAGGYIAGRGAPLLAAGGDAVAAAFVSIAPSIIRAVVARANELAPPAAWAAARDAAVVAGLRAYVPESIPAIEDLAPWLWDAVSACPTDGRVLAAAHIGWPRGADPLLSAWHAINCLREYRGDTHWALVVAQGLGAAEASILHNAWVGYEPDWIPRSRLLTDEEIERGWRHLSQRGLAAEHTVTPAGLRLRQALEDRTNELSTVMWEAVGVERATRFAEVLEPACEILLRRVDETAGDHYQPASRVHPGGFGTAGNPRA
jgi:hypothetical protein